VTEARRLFEELAAAVDHDDGNDQARLSKLKGLKHQGQMFVMFIGGQTLFKLPAAEASRLVADGVVQYHVPAGGAAPSPNWVVPVAANREDLVGLAKRSLRAARAARK
jgi:hypothetical protein